MTPHLWLSRHHTSRRRAFTLTELLIVVTIIAILASLITAAAINALNAGKRTRILAEINQIGNAMEEFKNDFFGAYPPNGLYRDDFPVNIPSDFTRMFKKAFPRHQEDPDLIRRLAGGEPFNSNAGPLPGGINAQEALYFWLGGFSDDPKFPISGPGGPGFFVDTSLPGNGEVLEERNRRYDFDLTRLGPRIPDGEFKGQFDEENGRFVIYTDPIERRGNRRINLWTYTPGGSDKALAYFDASRHAPIEYHPDLSGTIGQGLFPLTKVREGVSVNAARLGDLVYANDGKFQVIHSGIDDAWGEWSVVSVQSSDPAANRDAPIDPSVRVYPVGPFVGDDSDNLANFANGSLADVQE